MTDAYLSEHYASKDDSYYTGARTDYVALLPENPKARILELGCGNGATGALALERNRCGSYVGIEMFEPMAARAREVLSTVYVGNVETMGIDEPDASFDALIMSEVLEHLVNPDATVERLAKLLKPGALVFASSPNIANWRLIRDLVRGKFEYTESGTMDRTHLRWFTPTSFEAMFAQAGIRTEQIQSLGGPSPRRVLRALLGKRFGHLLWGQINFHGRKRG